MSDLDLKEFHSFLEDMIGKSSNGDQLDINKTVTTLLTRHPQKLEKIHTHIYDLGLRALIRNNCRAKGRSSSDGPDMFGHYRVGKLIPVPYRDGDGHLRYARKSRQDLSFDDLDSVMARAQERPARQSRQLRDLAEIARRTKAYRGKAKTVADALAMADRDGK